MPQKKVYATPPSVQRTNAGGWASRMTVKWNRMTMMEAQMAGDAKHVANIYWRFDKKRKGYLTEAEFCESLKGLNNVEPPADALVEIRFPKKGLKKKDYHEYFRRYKAYMNSRESHIQEARKAAWEFLMWCDAEGGREPGAKVEMRFDQLGDWMSAHRFHWRPDKLEMNKFLQILNIPPEGKIPLERAGELEGAWDQFDEDEWLETVATTPFIFHCCLSRKGGKFRPSTKYKRIGS